MKRLLATLALAPLATAALALAQAPETTPPAEAGTAAAPTVQKLPEGVPAVAEPPVGTRPIAPAVDAADQRAAALFERVLAPLELTEEQKAKVTEIRNAWLARTDAVRAEVRQAALAYQTLRRSNGSAPAEVDAKRSALGEAQAKLRKEIAVLDQEIAAALDPERREKFLAQRAQMQSEGESQGSTNLPAPSTQGKTPGSTR